MKKIFIVFSLFLSVLVLSSCSVGKEANIQEPELIIDGFVINDLDDVNYLGFGPMVSVPGPIGTFSELNNYVFEVVGPRDADNIIEELIINNSVVVQPEIASIEGVEYVKWSEGVDCDQRALEIIGYDKNYKLYNISCLNNQEYDFNYLESIASDIIINKSISSIKN
ncbi:MAG: hypothetical protein WC280_00100 [Patescibacteria group bacterium]